MAFWRPLTRGLPRSPIATSPIARSRTRWRTFWTRQPRPTSPPGSRRRKPAAPLGWSSATRLWFARGPALRRLGEHRRNVLADLRYGARRLRGSPGFAAVVIITLSLGIGASTTVFSAAKPILFDSLPYPDAHRIVTIWDFGTDGSGLPVTFGSFREMTSALARSSRSR